MVMPLVEENLSGLRGYEPDVLVLQQRPELRDVVPAHRLDRAQFLVRRVRIARKEVGRVKRELGTQGSLPRRDHYQTDKGDLSDVIVST